jgi:TRAP transporter TAXI family solute receptor
VEGTGGGSINPKWMADRKIEFGFQVLDMFSLAKRGERPYDKKYDLSHARSICLIGAAPTHLIVKRDSPLKGLKDLKGKRLSVGDRGASSNTRAFWFLEAAGLTKDDLKVEYIGDDQAAEALVDGKIDAICEVVGVPSGAFLSLSATVPIRFLPLTEDEGKRLTAKRPYMMKLAIPAGAYRQPEEVATYGVPSCLMVIDSVPEDLVNKMCKLIDSNWESLYKVHRTFREWRFDKNTAEITGQPLHPGALKFYKEKGIL